MNNLENIYLFIKSINEKSNGIIVDVQNVEIAEMIVKGKKEKFVNQDNVRKSEFKEKYNIDLTNEQLEDFYLTSCKLKWKRTEQLSGEGYLLGGFAFNGLTPLFESQVQFWKESTGVFDQSDQENSIDYNLLKQFRWLESPTPLNFAELTPQFGCVKFEQHKFPEQFYFYDSGLIFPLKFKSLEEYITNLICSAAVTCWQYFYIDPDLVISKNKGLKYVTWSLHSLSKLDAGLKKLEYNKNIKVDRLDLINEYLERCIRLLPDAFPFIDFSHHVNYYNNFKKKYDAEKN